jgi:hypothetical protein
MRIEPEALVEDEHAGPPAGDPFVVGQISAETYALIVIAKIAGEHAKLFLSAKT